MILKLKSAVTQIDMYGVGVQLNFQKGDKLKSLFGGIVSLITICILILICWFYGRELYQKANPKVIASLRQVTNSERIYVDKDNLIVMVGIQDKFSKSFVDPTVFGVTAEIQKMNYSIDPQTNLPKKFLTSTPRQIGACSAKDVGITSLQDYFQAQVNMPAYFCLKSTSQDDQSFLEGDFDQTSFAQMFIYIKKCTNSTSSNIICKPPETIDSIMGSTKISFYLSDKLIDPTDYSNPFKDKVNNQYSQISTKFQKEIQIYYSNSYILTDTGVLASQIEQQRGFAFTEIREVQFYDPTPVFCRVLLRIRKQKEDLLVRNYSKFVDIAAQIGGLLKLITLFGALITYPLQKLHLYKLIVDQIFTFQNAPHRKLFHKKKLY